ncbi:truncated transposase [Lacticaseibacillus rhamnosus GG]|uniref:Truncated transposase n=1 Tax=Lacticaseibacillus rhamnosus (strain ATCC 53103 / LMG 18243 / GG) TaxID=568703 RepID=A0A809N8B2_LACRG|nr:truncated transposase [Lacticaseibacillus rhamnosus GG]
MNDARINWQRMVLLVAVRLIQYLHQFVVSGRDQAFVIDDSLFSGW